MRVGVLGGGQLGRMLGLAGVPLGLRFRFLDAREDVPAAAVGEVHAGDYADPAVLERFADGLDVVTYEWENVPLETARFLAERIPLHPPAQALALTQERLVEKEMLAELGLPTPRCAAIDRLDDVGPALETTGLPALLKTRRLGYDGKGQAKVRSREEAEAAWRDLGTVPLLAEELVAFDREVSLVAVRSTLGETACYPLVRNEHPGGILGQTTAPAPGLSPALQNSAEDMAARLLEHLDYVGVLAVELFQVGADLLVNEIAPRVHNSGHWTIEGAETSQFENHLRAILGWPLGSTLTRGHSRMINLLGEAPPAERLASVEGAHVHLYGKAPRPGRKLGHVTVRGDDPEWVKKQAEAVRALCSTGREEL